MLLGSKEYDGNSDKSTNDDDFEYETTQSASEKAPFYSSFDSEEVKREARLIKLEGEQKQKRTAIKYKNKELKGKKLINDMNKVVTPKKNHKLYLCHNSIHIIYFSIY